MEPFIKMVTDNLIRHKKFEKLEHLMENIENSQAAIEDRLNQMQEQSANLHHKLELRVRHCDGELNHLGVMYTKINHTNDENRLYINERMESVHNMMNQFEAKLQQILQNRKEDIIDLNK